MLSLEEYLHGYDDPKIQDLGMECFELAEELKELVNLPDYDLIDFFDEINLVVYADIIRELLGDELYEDPIEADIHPVLEGPGRELYSTLYEAATSFTYKFTTFVLSAHKNGFQPYFRDFLLETKLKGSFMLGLGIDPIEEEKEEIKYTTESFYLPMYSDN